MRSGFEDLKHTPGGKRVRRQGILDTIFETLSPVHPDGHKFIAIGAAVTLLFFFLYPAARLALRGRDRVDRLFLS